MYSQEFENIFTKCAKYTQASKERCFALYNAIKYVVNNNIPGDLIECGVFWGGSAMVMAETLAVLNAKRRIVLFDTFQGMTEPGDLDIDLNGVKAKEVMTADHEYKCYAPIDRVKEILSEYTIEYVQGDVCETLNDFSCPIALLRLDTDWYESTKKELEVLYPMLSNKGILIVDDYGHWKGAREAVDEYFKNPMINWIDYTGILIQKYE